MQIVVDEALKAYIDPLTPEEHDALEQSLLREGCRDALVLWGDLLVDGHNRYGICQQHGLPFSTVQAKQFSSMEDVHLWMIEQHLGRRSLSDFQRGVLALRKRDILESRMKQAVAHAKDHAETTPAGTDAEHSPAAQDQATPIAPSNTKILTSREALAKAARISSNQVRMIEAIQAQATPEVVAAVKSGELSLNAAAAVAELPAHEQVTAASQGAKELKMAAKRVRDAKKKPKAAAEEQDTEHSPLGEVASHAPSASEAQLQARVNALETENEHLRMQVAALQRLLSGSDANDASGEANADESGAPF